MPQARPDILPGAEGALVRTYSSALRWRMLGGPVGRALRSHLSNNGPNGISPGGKSCCQYLLADLARHRVQNPRHLRQKTVLVQLIPSHVESQPLLLQDDSEGMVICAPAHIDRFAASESISARELGSAPSEAGLANPWTMISLEGLAS